MNNNLRQNYSSLSQNGSKSPLRSILQPNQRKAQSYIDKSPQQHKNIFEAKHSSKEEGKLESELIRESVDDLFKAINTGGGNPGGIHTKSLDSMFTIFSQIIINPYVDHYRIIDLQYFKSKFARYPQALKLLKDIGFKQGSTTSTLVFPYDQGFPKMMIAKELLSSKTVKKHEESSYSSIEAKINFPTFQKYSDILDISLIPKTAKEKRNILKLSIEDVQQLYDRTRLQTLQEYCIYYGQNAMEFSQIVYKIFINKSRAQEFLDILKELWIEGNVIRKAGVAIRQTFSDPISKANLCETNDYSRIARNLFPMDIMQAKGLRKATSGKLVTVQDVVFMFIEREAFNQQGLIGDMNEIDNMMFRGLLSKDKVEQFWKSTIDLIVERISKKITKKRPFIKEEDMNLYIHMEEPQLDIDDLIYETKIRIDNLDQIMEVKNRLKVERIKTKQLEIQYNQMVIDALWDPKTFFYQKQLIDDFVLFTMINNLCVDNNVQMGFNLRMAFRNFILDCNIPDINISQFEEQKQKLLMIANNNDQPLSIEQQYQQKDQQKQQLEQMYGSIFKDEWKNLYYSISPIIIQAAILNDHYDTAIELIEEGASINSQDFQGWTPLHCAAFTGDKKIMKFLIQHGSLVDIRDNQGRIPLEIAILNTNVLGEDSCAAILLKNGSPLSEDYWNKLLILSLDKDIVIYPKLAFQRGMYLHNVDDDSKFSFHNAVCCGAKNIIDFLGEAFGNQTMRRIGLTPDKRGMTALDYANISEDNDLKILVQKVMGELILKEKPKTLQEIEESSPLKTHGGNYLKDNPLQDVIQRLENNNSSKGPNRELKAFHKEYVVGQNINLVPQSYIDQQRQLKVQQEIQQQKKFFEQEMEIQKKEVVKQKEEFERHIKVYQQELQYQHREEIDKAKRQIIQKDVELEGLKQLVNVQSSQLEQLKSQFDELISTQQESKRLNMYQEQQQQQEKPKISDINQQRLTEQRNAMENINTQLKKNIESIESQMRETQNRMLILEKEKENIKKANSKACIIF